MSIRTRAPGLGVPLGVSAVLHLAAVTALVVFRAQAPRMQAPIYRVEIVAAPPGPRAEGIVTPTPTPARPEPAPPPTRAESPAKSMPAPPKATPKPRRTPPPAATPMPAPATKAPPSTKPPAVAGGGPTGSTGADVASVKTEGIDFPYPGYLNNIVRQIALRFRPSNPNAPLHAEVVFLIHRDGTVTGLSFRVRSGVYAFDLEAQGAIEAAASASAFGPLPDGFPEDVLPVTFSFDPRLIR